MSPMNLMPKEAIDPKDALRALPPMIKGYLRAGCLIGEGAVVDRQFDTTDVFIYLPRQGHGRRATRAGSEAGRSGSIPRVELKQQ